MGEISKIFRFKFSLKLILKNQMGKREAPGNFHHLDKIGHLIFQLISNSSHVFHTNSKNQLKNTESIIKYLINFQLSRHVANTIFILLIFKLRVRIKKEIKSVTIEPIIEFLKMTKDSCGGRNWERW
jgi:hypothetical protein